jgi:alpha-glucoside transport system substrate-binding protein
MSDTAHTVSRHITGRRVLGVCVALAALLGLGLYRVASASDAGSTLVVLTSWTDEGEADAFQAVVDAFTAGNPGVHIVIQASRDEQQVLQSDLQDGDPPDLAVLPDPGALAQYQADGYLVPLDGFADKQLGAELSAELTNGFGPMWNAVMDVGTRHPYGLVVKAQVKSLIWYGPGLPAADRQPPPATWNQLLALGGRIAATGTSPWCLGLLDTSTAGWPGTDWIADILLQQDGPKIYNAWVDGQLPWTSAQVVEAWQTWGRLVETPGQVYGGAVNALSMPLADSDNAMFPPESAAAGCDLSHTATLETGPGISPQPGSYGYFPFPGAAAQRRYEVSADLMGMFRDSPQAERFALFLAGPTAQAIWPGRQPDSAFSADTAPATLSALKNVYARDGLARGIEDILTGGSNTLCYGASDMMPPNLTAAFQRAVLQYVAYPSQLASILGGLDRIRPPVASAASGSGSGSSGPLTACASGN